MRHEDASHRPLIFRQTLHGARESRGRILMRFRLGAASTLSLTTLTLLVACGGKTISIGENEPATKSIAPSAVTVATAECNDGYEPSNICCKSGDSTSAGGCESWPDEPFHPCDSGWTLY